tara:strand:- start:1828 stop:2178 length:351 start_codon:yes stop_codon:yes gene_type:complete
MSLEVGLQILKELIMKEPSTLFKVPFKVENYKEVVEKLKIYKERNVIIINEEIKYILKTVFDFHLNDQTHALVFYSLGKNTALLLGRIKGKYINILLPIDDMICNFETSFLATYVP